MVQLRDGLMQARIAYGEAAQSFRSRMSRNLLTGIGVAIGVGALALNVGLSATASAQISDQFDAFLAQRVVLQSQSWDRVGPDWLDEISQSAGLTRVRALNGVRAAGAVASLNAGSPLRLSSYSSKYEDGSASAVSATVVAADPTAVESLNPQLVAGRLYDKGHFERASNVALVGSTLMARLHQTWKPNGRIWIGRDEFEVIGVISDRAPQGNLLTQVLVPSARAMSTAGALAGARVVVRVAPGAADVVGQQAPLALVPNEPSSIKAATGVSPRALKGEVADTTTLLLYLMAAVALIVGGIGVMNTFLVATLERRREIGVRLAVGAQRMAILLQFSLESLAVGFLGGVAGLVIAINTLTIVSIANRWQPVLDASIVVVGLSTGIVLGLLAGIYPAVRAARTDPLESLSN